MRDREHTKSSLMNKYSKEELVDYCMDLEHNIKGLRESFEIQYKNCMQIVDDMKLLNDTLTKVRKGVAE